MSEFNLSEKIQDGKRWLGEPCDFILLEDVKEFIKEINGKMQDRLEFLSQFDGLGEVMLQKAEISNIKKIIDKLAGDKLI